MSTKVFAIPPKEKTIYRDFTVEPYELMRLTAELVSQYAIRAWNFLKSHKPGWKTTVEEMAERFRCSVTSVYRGLAELEEKRLLIRTDDTFRLTVPEDRPICCTANTREEEDCAGAGARSSEGKDKKPTYLSSEISEGQEQNASVEAKRSPQSADTTEKERTTEKSAGTPPPDRPPTTPRQDPPKGAPDHAGRDAVPQEHRLRSIEAFLRAWSNEFSDGPSSLNYMTLPAMWQERVLWVYQHWTRQEIFAAYQTTADATPRKAWPYFRACLERIARGEWGQTSGGYIRTESGVAQAGATHAPAPPPPDNQRVVVVIADVARELGFDPDNLTADQRAECLNVTMRGAS